jgi:hypothetical protein
MVLYLRPWPSKAAVAVELLADDDDDDDDGLAVLEVWS